MALALNVSHPLYGNVLSFVCNDGGVIRDIKNTSETLTPNPSVTLGTGTYGAHFQTGNTGDTALGVPLPVALRYSLNATSPRTLYIVTNGQINSSNRRQIGGNGADSNVTTMWLDTTKVGMRGIANITGVNDVGTGARSFALTNNSGAYALYMSGEQEGSLPGPYAYGNGVIDQIGGSGGGRGYWSHKFVYWIWFNKALTTEEIATLEASLGANNAFALIDSGAVDGSADGGAGTSTGSGSGGDATGGSAVDGNAAGGTGTSTGSGSGGVATGQVVGAGAFVSEAMENNTGAGLLASIPIVWKWEQGTPGIAPTAVVYGSGTTSALGVLTATGLPAGAGALYAWTVDRTGFYYQPGTVT